jgi:hypothetical protein
MCEKALSHDNVIVAGSIPTSCPIVDNQGVIRLSDVSIDPPEEEAEAAGC